VAAPAGLGVLTSSGREAGPRCSHSARVCAQKRTPGAERRGWPTVLSSPSGEATPQQPRAARTHGTSVSSRAVGSPPEVPRSPVRRWRWQGSRTVRGASHRRPRTLHPHRPVARGPCVSAGPPQPRRACISGVRGAPCRHRSGPARGAAVRSPQQGSPSRPSGCLGGRRSTWLHGCRRRRATGPPGG